MITSNASLEAEILAAEGQWFVINCNTGHEDRVLADLLQKIKTSNLESDVFAVKIAKIPVLNKTGKEIYKNKFPGYIFINMIMSEKAWFIVRNTPGVTGFIGSSGRGAKPFPLSTDEVLSMLINEQNVDVEPQNTESIEKVVVPKKELKTADFEIGDFILIKEGPYANEEGKVIDMDYSKGIAIVSIEMFGRYTPAEVSFENAQPIKEY